MSRRMYVYSYWLVLLSKAMQKQFSNKTSQKFTHGWNLKMKEFLKNFDMPSQLRMLLFFRKMLLTGQLTHFNSGIRVKPIDRIIAFIIRIKCKCCFVRTDNKVVKTFPLAANCIPWNLESIVNFCLSSSATWMNGYSSMKVNLLLTGIM